MKRIKPALPNRITKVNRHSSSMSATKEKILKLALDIIKSNGNVAFVIGAGASVSAGVPTSSVLKSELLLGFRTDIEDVLKEKNPSLTPENASLEMLFSAYLTVTKDEDAVYKFLYGRIPNVKQALERIPPLGYEILSHLMNHELVKYVISMNFDELLEGALDDELGKSNYLSIIGRSAFRKLLDEELIEEGLKKVLFKPHGTVSLSATLRPTWESVTSLEKDEKLVFEKIFSKKLKKQQHPCLVFVGYSFNDSDMKDLFLSLAAQRRLRRVYFVDLNPEILKDAKVKALLMYANTNIEDYFIEMDSDTFFRRLAKALFETKNFYEEELQNSSKENIKSTVEELIEKGKFYQKIHRHRIRDILFRAGIEPNLENRLLIELIIFGIKARGKFKSKVLTKCKRIQNYYNQLLQLFRERTSKESPKAILDKISIKDTGIFVNIDGDKFGKEAYYCPGKSGKEMANTIFNKIKTMCIEDKIATKSQGFNIDAKTEGKLKKLMKELTNDFDYDLEQELLFAFSFDNPDIIKNRKRFGEETEKIIKTSSNLRIIAETGEWLVNTYKDLIEEKIKTNEINKIRLIISNPKDLPSDSFHRNRAAEVCEKLSKLKYQGKIKIAIKTIRWEDNKHHMALGNKRGIYFFREGKSSSFMPVLVEGNDYDNIKRYFDTLWNRLNRNYLCKEERDRDS